MPASTDSNHAERESDHIAIVGLSTRFAGEFSDTEKLWEGLLQARCAATPIPKSRFNADAFYHPDPEHRGTFAVKGGSFLSEDPGYFDGGFFNFVKTELLSIDPQQRLLLESVYQALENAGLPLDKVVGSNTSVYVSGWNHDHRDAHHMDPEATSRHRVAGTSNTFLSNRVSWFYGFQGQSMTIDTACSSSMVCLHQAVQSLCSGESEMAVISGASVMSHPFEFTSLSQYGVLGAEGISYSFDHRANGYGRGEGVGSIVLKPVSAAVRDGDTIRAVIRGSGVNHNGHSPGISAPSGDAQTRLIRDVYQNAGLTVNNTAFVEAHGTGTQVGDPIEASAIASAFQTRKRTAPLFVGAIKSGIGHLEGASGIAGIIKSILILENAVVPPNANFEKSNSTIDVTKLKIAFPPRSLPWPNNGLRRISVNSFGVGGTNAHVILDDAYHYLLNRNVSAFHNTREEPPTQDELHGMLDVLGKEREKKFLNGSPIKEDFSNGGPPSVDKSASNGTLNGSIQLSTDLQDHPKIFPISAFDKEGIQRNAASISAYLSKSAHSFLRNPPTSTHFLDDLAFTLSDKRTNFSWRNYVVAKSVAELATKLENGSIAQPVHMKSLPKIAFVFTGQGAQHYRMGRVLMHYPVFRKSLEDAAIFMQNLGDEPWDLLAELGKSEMTSRVYLPHVAHPACVALQIALIELLNSWNIVPSSVIGHSSGEIPAAYSAGKISREGAWKAAYYRGKVSSRALSTSGAMLAVGLSADKLTPYLEQVKRGQDGELIIACYNSPNNNTVSGDARLCDALKALLDTSGVFTRKLNVPNAYHSAHMMEVGDEYLEFMDDLSPNGHFFDTNEEIVMFSTVRGRRIVKKRLDAQYWVDNLISPVRFVDGLLALCKGGFGTSNGATNGISLQKTSYVDHIIELGPHAALQSAIKEIVSEELPTPVQYLSVLHRNDIDHTLLLDTIGHLKIRGSPVNLARVNQSPSAHKPKALVGLPPYSFNHSTKIMAESRLTREYRRRKHPNHDLLGTLTADSTPETSRWRHFISVDEVPWVTQHNVTSQCVYPGAGFVIMAIEAMRQLADPNARVQSFSLKQVSLKQALIIPDTKEGVETCMTITAAEESSEWRSFRISSYNPTGEAWIEHCTGYVSVDYAGPTGPVDAGREAQAQREMWRQTLESVSASCRNPIDFSKTYEGLNSIGLAYGPLFRNLCHVKTSGQGEVTGQITIPNAQSAMPKKFIRPHLIHPTTMDSMLHLFLGAILDLTGRTSLEKAAVPTYIDSLWVSANIPAQAGHHLRGYARAKQQTFDKFACDIKMWDGDEGCLEMGGLVLTPLDSGNTTNLQSRNLCHNPIWTPDINLLDSTTAHQLISPPLDEPNHELEKFWAHQYQLAIMLLIADALAELKRLKILSCTGHWKQFYEWMKQQHRMLMDDQIPFLSKSIFAPVIKRPELKMSVYDQVEAHSPEGAIVVRMGKNIVRAINGDVEPLQVLMEDKLMHRYYDQLIHTGDLPPRFNTYLATVAKDRNGLKILEVGAGTGSATAVILGALSPRGTPDMEASKSSKIANYTFTDISSGFFENAKERFKPWASIVTFQTLDAATDAIAQGFEAGSYDFIFAGNVIHATADLRKTLSNLRTLLKPGGKIILQEATRAEFRAQLAFGQLPGWWLSVEKNRRWGPILSPPEWDVILRDSGFSGLDVEMPSSQIPDFYCFSIMVSSPLEENRPRPKIAIVVPGASIRPTLLQPLMDILSNSPSTEIIVTDPAQLHEIDLANFVCISLLELENSALQDPDQEKFMAVKTLLSKCIKLLWVTGDLVAKPELNMAIGLLRTLRWERDAEDVNLVTVAISHPTPPDNALAEMLSRIYDHQFVISAEDNMNAEYMYNHGIVYAKRFQPSLEGNNFLASKLSKPGPEKKMLGEVTHPIKLSTSSPGLLDKLEWVPDTTHISPLENSEVEIDIRAVGLNFRDLMIAMGEYKAFSLGVEAAGVVSKVGCSVAKLKPGDRVVYMSSQADNGCFRTRGRVEECLVVKIPDTLTFEIAASLPCIYGTVIYGLRNAARLSAGETILIHAAAGGVGQAAIHYCKMVGAEIYATVSTPEKRQLLVQEYGIREDHIFSSRDLSFAQGVMRMTKGRGVDVVLNSLAGDALRRTWDCVAPFGRFIEIGNKDAHQHGKLDLNPFVNNVTMASVNLQTMTEHRPELVGRLIADTLQLHAQGEIKEVSPITVMGFAQVEEGLRLLQSGNGMGKYVFVPRPNDCLPVVPSAVSPHTFRQDASYVMAGGLGGLGRSIAQWMVSRNAKNFIFLSRSGRRTPLVDSMVAEFKEKGCRAEIFQCDVSDSTQLKAVIDKCAATMPPIKGCIQGAMCLQDAVFENMRYQDWKASIAPKVQGSWNLHSTLPKDLDFFLMMSSLTGVFGNRSQSNYAAGNTYQDSLAKHRNAQGLAASTVDLGVIDSVGFVAENQDYAKHISTLLPEPIHEEELHSIIEFLIDPRHKSEATQQLAFGFSTDAAHRERGLEPPSILRFPMYAHMREHSVHGQTRDIVGSAETNNSVVTLLSSARTVEEAVSVVADGIRAKIASMLSLAVEAVDATKSIASYGIDSLSAIEVRTWIVKDLSADVPFLQLVGSGSILRISEKVVSVSKLVRFEKGDLGRDV